MADGLGYGDGIGFVTEDLGDTGARDFIWRDLRSKCRVDAAYFEGGVPLVAFADGSEEHTRDVHRRLWNFARTPILIATTPQRTTAYSCNVPGTSGQSDFDPVLVSASADQDPIAILHEFHRYNVVSGAIQDKYSLQLSTDMRVDRLLLENLRELQQRLRKTSLSDLDVEALIGRSIFVRYLENRGIVTPDHLRSLGAVASFDEALQTGDAAVATLFRALADHFNGDVFSYDLPPDLPAEVTQLITEFLSGTDLKSGQRQLWPYDFGVIPPELVSSIYEQLLESDKKKNAAYYTPRHVVDVVLDELVPWHPNDPDETLTILDPSCGSGIFLTEAYRRLAYRHLVVQQQTPSFAELSRLLTDSIHGVDLSGTAIGVTAFSLYLALLEQVDPPTAWRDARLPTLVGTNLIASDFFADHILAERKFDVVVGNPPWKSKLTPLAAAFADDAGLKLPDKQIALAFLWRSHMSLKEDGVSGLVLPAKPLLHNRSSPSVSLRKRMFKELHVEMVIDLSPVRHEVFDGASGPAAIAITSSRSGRRFKPLASDTLHLSPRQTPLSRAISGLIVSQTRIQTVEEYDASNSTLVWKTLLWGGLADFRLVKRLAQRHHTLATEIQERGWYAGQGFQVGKDGGDRNDASALLDMKILDTSSVGDLRVAVSADRVVDEVMHRPRDPRLYQGPLVIMRKGFSQFPNAAYYGGVAAFTEALFGIAGPARHRKLLKSVAAILNSTLAHYWYFLTSSSWGVEREQVQISEFLTLPLPSLTPELVTSLAEVTDLARSADRADWGPHLDRVVFDAYELAPFERDLISDAISLAMEDFRLGPSSRSFRTPTTAELDAYAGLLAELLSSVSDLTWHASHTRTESGYVVVECFLRDGHSRPSRGRPVTSQLVETVETRGEEWQSPALIIQPAAIVIEDDSVAIVKLAERWCWSRSQARQDAAEILGSALDSLPADSAAGRM